MPLLDLSNLDVSPDVYLAAWLKPLAGYTDYPPPDWKNIDPATLKELTLAYLGDAIAPNGILRTGGQSPSDTLGSKIRAALLNASFEAKIPIMAVKAATEAAQFAERTIPRHVPRISISSDGIV